MSKIIDAIWKERNNCLHNKCKPDPLRVLASLSNIHKDALILSDHQMKKKPSDSAPIPTTTSQTRHTFFTDATVRNKNSMCVWVYMGLANTLKLAAVASFDTVSLVEVECLAIWEACNFIYKEKLCKCSIFSDAKVVVEDIAKGKPCPWKLVTTMDDIARICKTNCIGIFFIPRDHNYIAHNLAKWAAHSNFVGQLPDRDVPSSIFNVL